MLNAELLSAGISSYVVIALAEIGDKSQLVCMTLAARHRHWPVLLGAIFAFLILNTLAVLFGAGVAAWIPEQIMAGLVALLFAAFGFHLLRNSEDEESVNIEERSGHGVFVTTFLLIIVSEFGDKTQIAVAGLAGVFPILTVWIGASLALITTSALGVWVGRTLLQRLPVLWLHRLSGGFFLLFSAIAAFRALSV